MRRTNKNLNVINKIETDGSISEVITYDGKFSARYTLALYFCKLFKLDYLNKGNIEKAYERIKAGISQKTCFFEENGAVYSCVAREGKLYDEGIDGSDYDFVPAI